MATLNDETTAGQRRSGPITLAAVLYVWFGLGVTVSNLLIVIYALRAGALPVLFGIDFLAGPFLERFGLSTALLLTVPWAIVNLLEVVAGYWLWKSRQRGALLGLVLFPIGAIFWTGYAIPIMALVGPLRVLLIAMRWESLR